MGLKPHICTEIQGILPLLHPLSEALDVLRDLVQWPCDEFEVLFAVRGLLQGSSESLESLRPQPNPIREVLELLCEATGARISSASSMAYASASVSPV